jgi:hypothetical protein
LNLSRKLSLRQDINDENYFTYGALVLALPIESVEEKTKTFPVPGFYNLKYAPKNVVVYEYANEPVSVDHKTLRFKTSLLNPVSKQKESVELIPMGQTILRQVTFK